MTKKHHVSTNISMKHWALLKKHAEKYDTYQKVLELALENLDNDSRSGTALTKEEAWILHMGRDVKPSCLIPKEVYKELISTADIERHGKYTASVNPLAYIMEDYYQKPLTECTLKEVVEGLVFTGRASNIFDIVNYADNGDYYTVKMTHEMGIKHSKIIDILINGIFKAYGAGIESKISEKNIFIKVPKNTQYPAAPQTGK